MLCRDSGACGVSVAESVLAPPGPIPNPVVTQYSAGEYCSGDAVGGEAAAGTSQVLESDAQLATLSRGGAVAARWAHNPKVGGSNPPPATTDDPGRTVRVRSFVFNPPLILRHEYQRTDYRSVRRGLLLAPGAATIARRIIERYGS